MGIFMALFNSPEDVHLKLDMDLHGHGLWKIILRVETTLILDCIFNFGGVRAVRGRFRLSDFHVARNGGYHGSLANPQTDAEK